jgi:hypothetical protein
MSLAGIRLTCRVGPGNFTPILRDQLGDVLRLPKRHPAYRRREAQSGSCTERENLTGDAKRRDAASSQILGSRTARHCSYRGDEARPRIRFIVTNLDHGSPEWL